MSDVAYARDVMRDFVEGRPGSSVKQKLAAAARSLHWNYSRARSVFYGEARRIEASEMDQLCRAAGVERQLREVAHDHDQLISRLARMEEMLAVLMAAQAGNLAART